MQQSLPPQQSWAVCKLLTRAWMCLKSVCVCSMVLGAALGRSPMGMNMRW